MVRKAIIFILVALAAQTVFIALFTIDGSLPSDVPFGSVCFYGDLVSPFAKGTPSIPPPKTTYGFAPGKAVGLAVILGQAGTVSKTSRFPDRADDKRMRSVHGDWTTQEVLLSMQNLL